MKGEGGEARSGLGSDLWQFGGGAEVGGGTLTPGPSPTRGEGRTEGAKVELFEWPKALNSLL